MKTKQSARLADWTDDDIAAELQRMERHPDRQLTDAQLCANWSLSCHDLRAYAVAHLSNDPVRRHSEPLPTRRELIAAVERYGDLRASASPFAAAVMEGIRELLADVYDVLDALDTVQ